MQNPPSGFIILFLSYGLYHMLLSSWAMFILTYCDCVYEQCWYILQGLWKAASGWWVVLVKYVSMKFTKWFACRSNPLVDCQKHKGTFAPLLIASQKYHQRFILGQSLTCYYHHNVGFSITYAFRIYLDQLKCECDLLCWFLTFGVIVGPLCCLRILVF